MTQPAHAFQRQNITFRIATASDAALIGALAEQTFRETFHHYDPQALDEFFKTHYNVDEAAKLLALKGSAAWIAEVQGRSVAYAIMLDYRHNPQAKIAAHLESDACELRRLYVLQEYKGQGLGTALMEQALACAHARRYPTFYLSVWSGNISAQNFYARYGFEKIAEYDYPPIGEVVDREWVMKAQLA